MIHLVNKRTSNLAFLERRRTVFTRVQNQYLKKNGDDLIKKTNMFHFEFIFLFRFFIFSSKIRYGPWSLELIILNLFSGKIMNNESYHDSTVRNKWGIQSGRLIYLLVWSADRLHFLVVWCTKEILDLFLDIKHVIISFIYFFCIFFVWI